MTDRLAQIKARAEAATSEPWLLQEDDGDTFRAPAWEIVHAQSGRMLARVPDWAVSDAEFIAHVPADVPWLVDQLEQARSIAVGLENEVARLRGLVADFMDPDPCHYDHHGYCQAHSWLQTDPACPHRRARELEGGAA
ncbi:hypothetical protein ACH4FX_12310 [Streptomyces sp. NPDC018019]|uniref:hypothetical protein n=1 Tax=Streptomyces sp. NPDC018019 TaxID=3365030 RepID=UPI00379BEEAA